MLDGLEHRLLRNFDGPGHAEAAHLTGRAFRTLFALFPLIGTLVFIDVTFRPIVAAGPFDSWLGGMVTVIAMPAVMTVMFAIQGPANEAALRPYFLLSYLNSFGLASLIAISVWLLLPHADLALQLLMVVLYVTFVAMMLGADTSPAVMIEQLGIMASLIAFVLIYRLPYAVPLAAVLGAVALSLVGLHRMLYRSTRTAIDARAETESANAALKTAVAQLAAERDAKTRFIAAASHDLRQPIQAAALYLDHALNAVDPVVRERAVKGAHQAFGSIDALLDTMLQHLRLEAGAEIARIEPIDLNDVLAHILDDLAPAADEAGIRLTAVASSKTVSADAALLRRVLGNIVGNAIRHSCGRSVLIGARQKGSEIVIWVIDDGKGLDAADQIRLFEDYAQGGGTNNAPGGFGIGLSSSRRMARLMNGDVAVDPLWTGGAAFHVRLPAAQRPGKERLWKAA